jgi:hypothetical protein
VPLLEDGDVALGERVAELLAGLGGDDALRALLGAEETDRLERRAGMSHVTFAGRLSPYLLAVARAVTGGDAAGWELARRPAYEGEEALEALVAPVRARLGGATPGAPVAQEWTTARLLDLLARGGGSLRGGEVHYLDGRAYVTDRERCRRLGCDVAEERGESTTTVYGEKQELVATVTCTDGAVRLVGDVEDVRAAEGAS